MSKKKEKRWDYLEKTDPNYPRHQAVWIPESKIKCMACCTMFWPGGPANRYCDKCHKLVAEELRYPVITINLD